MSSPRHILPRVSRMRSEKGVHSLDSPDAVCHFLLGCCSKISVCGAMGVQFRVQGDTSKL